MKLKYFAMSAAILAMCSVSFTSCSDDDNDAPAVSAPELSLPTDVTLVKVGTENRVALPILDGAGTYHAYSLDPTIVDVVEGPNGAYLEALKNGTTSVIVSDAAGTYKRLPVAAYTVPSVTLSHSDFAFEVPLGFSSTTKECTVLDGNGEYTVKSSSNRVSASVDEEGVLSITATAGKDPYTAVLTVKDASDFSSQVTVSVTPTFNAFTANDIETILASTANQLFAQCKDPSDGTRPYYYPNYGKWVDGVANGVKTVGWWMDYYGSNYGGLKVEFPESAQVGQEVAGKLYFQYSYYAWYDTYTYEGTAKVLEDNDTRVVVIWWNADLENERLNRAYFVHYK